MHKAILACGVFLASLNAIAAVPHWQIDAAHSSLTFIATQNNAPVYGAFKTFTGDINFDPKNLAQSHVRVSVDTASVSTSYPEIMNTLKTPDWFASVMFPKAVFESERFFKTAPNTYQAKGKLTIRDKAEPVTLTFTLEKYTQNEAQVRGSAALQRTVFGIGRGEWVSTDSIKDNVRVEFTLAAHK